MNPRIRKPGAARHWNIETIVADLRHLRAEAHEKRAGPVKLPSRKALIGIMEGFSAALFPNRLGLCEITGEGVDFYVGHTLNVTLTELLRQVRLEFEFMSGVADLIDPETDRAASVVAAFARQLPKVRALLDTDIHAAYDGDPAAHSIDEVLICYPGVTAMIHHRIAHLLYKLGAPLLARMIAEIAHSATGIDIHPGAEIGERFFIDHGTGVVIGRDHDHRPRRTSLPGRHARGQTLLRPTNMARSSRAPRHPIVEDDVVIYAGATILGRVTIGRGSSIGGNVWLTRSVPPGSTISQAQVRSEDFHDGAGI